jgi:DNA-binding transcriptional ArsR family regulator
MSDKITLDRETFKALAADTRVDMLKKLAERKLTLTDLSNEMGMSPSTIKEHLDRLVEAGLIEPDDRGMKWKYYRLTSKGRNIVSPNETKVWILLGTTILILAASTLSLSAKMAAYVQSSQVMSQAAPTVAGYAAPEAAENDATSPAPLLMSAVGPPDEGYNESGNQPEGSRNLMGSAKRAQEEAPPVESDQLMLEKGSDTGEDVNEVLTVQERKLPYAEAAIAVSSLAAAAACAAYLFRRRLA